MPLPDLTPRPEAEPPLHLRVAAHLEAVEQARVAVLRYLGAGPLTPRTAYRVELVLEEVLMNVARHGCAPGDRPEVDLVVVRAGDQVTLMFEDEGVAFDPTAASPREVPARLADLQPGGRGLVLLRRQARRLRYQRIGDRNRLEVDIDLP